MSEITLSPETLERLRSVSGATVTMQLLKRGIRNIFIRKARPLDPGGPCMVGEAYTVRLIPMREDLGGPEVFANPEYPPRKAIEDIPAGEIMVIDARGHPDGGVIGDILMTRLKVRGVAGLVSDGPVRDAETIRALGVPVFCQGGAAPAGITVHFGADLQRPIACGEVAVFPGDVLIGDGDGVVVIPRSIADEVARDSVDQERMEEFIQAKIAAGSPIVGTYPPNAETKAEYEAWKKDR